MKNFFFHSPIYNARRGRKKMAVAQVVWNVVSSYVVLAAMVAYDNRNNK